MFQRIRICTKDMTKCFTSLACREFIILKMKGLANINSRFHLTWYLYNYNLTWYKWPLLVHHLHRKHTFYYKLTFCVWIFFYVQAMILIPVERLLTRQVYLLDSLHLEINVIRNTCQISRHSSEFLTINFILSWENIQFSWNVFHSHTTTNIFL